MGVYFELATAHFSRTAYRPASKSEVATLTCRAVITFLTKILMNNVNSTVARHNVTDVATMAMEVCQSPWSGE